MEGDIFEQGMNLMAFGMGTVFAFLTLLVIATSIMSAILGKFFHVSQQDTKSSMVKKAGDDQQVVSAIMAAIKLHRSRRKK